MMSSRSDPAAHRWARLRGIGRGRASRLAARHRGRGDVPDLRHPAASSPMPPRPSASASLHPRPDRPGPEQGADQGRARRRVRPEVLATPDDRGFDLSAWIVPALAYWPPRSRSVWAHDGWRDAVTAPATSRRRFRRRTAPGWSATSPPTSADPTSAPGAEIPSRPRVRGDRPLGRAGRGRGAPPRPPRPRRRPPGSRGRRRGSRRRPPSRRRRAGAARAARPPRATSSGSSQQPLDQRPLGGLEPRAGGRPESAARRRAPRRPRPPCAGCWRSGRARTGRSRRGCRCDCWRASSRSRSTVVSWLRWSMKKRAASTPMSSISSSRVDELAAALRHLRPLAALDDVDELHDQRLEARPGRRRAPASAARIRADVAVVVGAEHVDQAVEAALELVAVVGDVGGEVGRLAVGADQDPVLVVAELGRAQPGRALALVDVAARRAARSSAASTAPVVVQARARRTRCRSSTPKRSQRRLGSPPASARRRGAPSASRSLGLDALGRASRSAELAHVVALVAVLGRLGRRVIRAAIDAAKRSTWPPTSLT